MNLQQWSATIAAAVAIVTGGGTVAMSVTNNWPVTWEGLSSWAERHVEAPINTLKTGIQENYLQGLDIRRSILASRLVMYDIRLRDAPTDPLYQQGKLDTAAELKKLDFEYDQAQCELRRLRGLGCAL